MSANHPAGNTGDIITPSRPLPARPNLEFERKAAKKLLRALNAGDPDALRRASAQSVVGASNDARITERSEKDRQRPFILADAQFIIAREYGFMSWRLLVSYFEGVFRQTEVQLRSLQPGSRDLDQAVMSILSYHRRGGAEAGLPLASWVPRFYGKSVAEALATHITIEDARLAVARSYFAPSWEVLVARNAKSEAGLFARLERPESRASNAIRNADLHQLRSILDANPELCEQPRGPGGIGSLLHIALSWERKNATDASHTIVEFLVARGADLQFTLNSILLDAFVPLENFDVDYWLARGADPSWTAPTGIPVLEYLMAGTPSGGNPRAVDTIARLVTPRKALWISAGLGDVRGVRRYFDRKGNLKPSARINRPDFTAMTRMAVPFLPDADDISVVWEAFYVAGLNERIEVLDTLLKFGFPVDHAEWGIPLLMMSIWHRRPEVTEFLISRGADPAARWVTAGSTARDLAEQFVAQEPSNKDLLRILYACGGRDAAVISREQEAGVMGPITTTRPFEEIFSLARDDAARMERREVAPDNLVVGMLRLSNDMMWSMLHAGGVDVLMLREKLGDRFVKDVPSLTGAEIPLSDAVARVMSAATIRAMNKRRAQVHFIDLFIAVLKSEDADVASLLESAGGNIPRVLERTEEHW